jgi:hypothetical protein
MLHEQKAPSDPSKGAFVVLKLSLSRLFKALLSIGLSFEFLEWPILCLAWPCEGTDHPCRYA